MKAPPRNRRPLFLTLLAAWIALAGLFVSPTHAAYTFDGRILGSAPSLSQIATTDYKIYELYQSVPAGLLITDHFSKQPQGQNTQELFWPTDQHEIIAHILKGKSRAVGTAHNIQGGFTAAQEVNLNASPHLFDNDHSGQFLSNYMTRRPFYDVLLDRFNLEKNEP